METQEFEDYANERVQEAGRLPLAGSLELTARCNLRCAHCYMTSYRAEPELDTTEAKRILDEMADAGCVRLLLTGGEPLLRDDFRDIWSHACSKGFLLTLFTNATLADEDTVAFLAGHPPMLCEVSLYGASPESYGRVCGHREAYDKAVAGLRRLAGALPHVGVKSTLLRENRGDVEAMAALCADIGVEYNYDTDVFPRLDHDLSPFDHALSPEEGIEAVLDSDLHRRAWSREGDGSDAPPTPTLKRADKIVVCRAGESSFHVGPYGDLCLCMLLREPHYSLREGDFLTGWRTAIADLIERERTTPEACSQCPSLAYCVPCAGRNFLETGSVEKPAPLQCRRAHAIAAAVSAEGKFA